MNFSEPKEILEQFHVDPGMVVADFGAGSGHYTRALAYRVGTTGKVYAVEVQRDVLERLRSDITQTPGINNVQFVWGDIDEDRGSTLPDHLCDRIIMSNVLFQLQKKANAIREMKRVLKAGGKVLFIDWSDSYGHIGPHPDSIISESQALSLFEEQGFTFEKDVVTGPHHYGLIFKKA